MLLLALSLSLLVQQPAAAPEEELPAISVRGNYLDYRLRVSLAGADTPSDLIVSADPGMNCGDPRFDRSPGPYRQCWLRGRRNTAILLTAQGDGVFGRDWTVDWTGCEPTADGRSCAVAIAGEMVVGATFRSL